MKTQMILLLGCGVACGCALNRPNVSLEPVGPGPAITQAKASEGELVVYTAWDPTASSNGSDVVVQHHTDYKIYSADGQQLVKTVYNMAGTLIEDPAPATLPPGNYTVVARALHFGSAAVPVVIEAGQTTAVHLDGSGPHVSSADSQTNFVHLPDGTIIGWRAKKMK